MLYYLGISFDTSNLVIRLLIVANLFYRKLKYPDGQIQLPIFLETPKKDQSRDY